MEDANDAGLGRVVVDLGGTIATTVGHPLLRQWVQVPTGFSGHCGRSRTAALALRYLHRGARSWRSVAWLFHAFGVELRGVAVFSMWSSLRRLRGNLAGFGPRTVLILTEGKLIELSVMTMIESQMNRFPSWCPTIVPFSCSTSPVFRLLSRTVKVSSC